jgi:hypothetical protein
MYPVESLRTKHGQDIHPEPTGRHVVLLNFELVKDFYTFCVCVACDKHQKNVNGKDAVNYDFGQS